jgi:hypothetical protein
MLIGGGIGALAAYAGMQLGDTYGGLLPFGAGVIGAVVGAGVSSVFGGRTKAPSQPPASLEEKSGSVDQDAESLRAATAPGADAPPAANTSHLKQGGDSPLTPKSDEPEWPVETHEIQLKLDLAREYLDVGESDLAVQLLQEVFELEIATAEKLNSELLRETRDNAPDNVIGDRES